MAVRRGPRKRMAAMEETGPKVEERPATHHKKAQTYLLGLAIFLVVVFAISAYSKMTNSAPKLFVTEESRQPRIQDLTGKRHSAGFADEVAKMKQKLPRPSSLVPVQTVSAPVTIQQVRWPQPSPPPVSPKNQQRVEELVYASRVENLDVDLGFGGSRARARKPVVPPPQGRRSSIQAEIARVTQLRNNLLTKGPSALKAPAARPAPSVGAASLLGATPATVASPVSVPHVVPSVVGKARSEQAKPLPGQKLLPLTTVIRAALDQKVISDYVGPLRLLVVDDVYDVQRHHVLIPKGSKVLAQSLLIGNVNAPIQSRMGIAVKQMVLPNGTSIDFSRQAGLDREGIAAIKGSTDYHVLEQLLGVAAYALLSAGTSRQGSGIANDGSFEGEVGASARDQFRPLVARYLSLVPTITLEPGTPMRIFLQEEMWIAPWKAVGHRFVAGRS